MNNPRESFQPENILIVDDRPENIKILTQILSDQGYQVRKAIHGEMALNSAFSKPPDLILLDIIMPGMDGYQVCKKLKENSTTSQIPIIFISALDEAFNKVKAFEVGGVDYITKPFQFQEVLARVQLQLRLQQQKQQLEKQNQKLREEISRRKQAETHLRLFNQAISACRNGVIITDATQSDNPIIYVNPAFEKITGYSASEVLGKNCRFLQREDRNQPNLEIIRKALKNEEDCLVIMRNYRKDGTLFWNEVSISPVRDYGGNVTHYIGIQTDITERKKIEEALQQSEEKFASAFRASPDPMVISTLEEGRYLEVNESFCRLMGYQREEVIDKTVEDIQIWANPQDRLIKIKALKEVGFIYDKEFELRTKTGEIKTLLISAERIEIKRQNCILTVAKDITERRRILAALEAANQKLQHLANIDGLTQIANRRKFDETLEQQWKHCFRQQQPLSLILCDVDYFKPYNDYYGHQTGDECLIQVAQAIRQAVNARDLVARYGGEEFVVILTNTDVDGAVQVAELIRDQIRQLKIPHVKSDISQYITLSLGISSVIPCSRITLDSLIHAADSALYQAKKQGRDRIIIPNPV
ncbi:diguanylate cyclase domain-containing protein [Capilliphycus salinus ALCB114379]|uniref:diguanylate cyclase domain-containing protein n=1 Tax=Capilliphycus salinus TaxID=2768948 RepID=UPI0039A42D3B